MDYIEESNQEDLNDLEENETPENEEEVDDSTDLEERLKKAEEVAENQRIRAEKAEKKLKARPAKTETETPKNEKKFSLDEIDEITALSSIPKEDRAEVLEYAEAKGIKPSEALEKTFVKVYLREQEEARKSAQASNTGGGRGKTASVSDAKILADAANGKEVDPERYAEAMLNKRIKKE